MHCKIKGLPSIWPALLQHMLTPGVMCLVWGDIRRLSSMSASLHVGQPFQQQQRFLQGTKPPTQNSALAKTSANQPALTIVRDTRPSKAQFKVPSFHLCGAILFAGGCSQLLIWFSPDVGLQLSREPVTIDYPGGVGGLRAPSDVSRFRNAARTLAGVT